MGFCKLTLSQIYFWFLNRMELERGGKDVVCVSLRVPPTRRPSTRAAGSHAPMVDVYGFRGTDVRFTLLSPFEFFMYWRAEAVLPPHHVHSNGRSVWCPGGREYYDAHKDEYPRCRLIPSKHYKVVTDSADFVTFP